MSEKSYGTVKIGFKCQTYSSFGVDHVSGETSNSVGAVTAGAIVNRRSVRVRLGIVLKVSQFCDIVVYECMHLSCHVFGFDRRNRGYS